MTAVTIIKSLIAYANELVDLGADREARAVQEFLHRIRKEL